MFVGMMTKEEFAKIVDDRALISLNRKLKGFELYLKVKCKTKTEAVQLQAFTPFKSPDGKPQKGASIRKTEWKKNGRETEWYWVIWNGRKVALVLNALKGLLVRQKEQQEIAIAFQTSVKENKKRAVKTKTPDDVQAQRLELMLRMQRANEKLKKNGYQDED